MVWRADGRPLMARAGDVVACFGWHARTVEAGGPPGALVDPGPGTLRFIRWFTGRRACPTGSDAASGDDDASPEAAAARADLVAAWELPLPPDARGRTPMQVQRVGERVRTDRLAYDQADRLTAWHHLEAEAAAFATLRPDGLRARLEVLRWPAGRALPAFGSLEGVAFRDHLEDLVVDQDADGRMSRVRDRMSGLDLAVSTESDGRLTALGGIDLRRDAQGRPASDTYDAAGLRTAGGGGAVELVRDGEELLASRMGVDRVYLPPLPGLQVGRDGRGRWEVALLGPADTAVALLALDGTVQWSALYDPFGDADVEGVAASGDPRRWHGHLAWTPPPGQGGRGEPQVLDAGQRLHIPALGRLAEPDPLWPDPMDPAAGSTFLAFRGDPVLHADADGRLPFLIGFLVRAAVEALANTLVDFAVHKLSGQAGPFEWGRALLRNGIGALAGGLTRGLLGKVLGGASPMRRMLVGQTGDTVGHVATDAADAAITGHWDDFSVARSVAASLATSAVLGVGGRALRSGPGKAILKKTGEAIQNAGKAVGRLGAGAKKWLRETALAARLHLSPPTHVGRQGDRPVAGTSARLRQAEEAGADAAEDLRPVEPPSRAGGANGAGAAKGGAAAVRTGQAGEAAVRGAFDIGPKEFIRINGRGRIPDGLTRTALSEVKNVESLSFTRQLRDFADYAKQTGRRFDLYVRPDTKLSPPLSDAVGDKLINLRQIPQ